MKRFFLIAVILGVIGMVLIFPLNIAEVNATESINANSCKYFTNYVVEKIMNCPKVADNLLEEALPVE